MIAEDDDSKVPVVAVVGFLPASKEGNLLKHILTGEHGKRVAVVRYADCLGVDGAELERCTCSQCVVDGVDLVETANGCAVACCRRHGDLAAALKKLKARQGCHLFSRLDKIIIEGADACDAADVHVAFLDQEVASFARLDAIVSCVRPSKRGVHPATTARTRGTPDLVRVAEKIALSQLGSDFLQDPLP